MPFKIYRASDPFLPRFGTLQNDFPGEGGRFRFYPRLKCCCVATYAAAVLVSSWESTRTGQPLDALQMNLVQNPGGRVAVVDSYSAHFPNLTSCLCCCYYYLKPQIDIVDSLGVHHANCGRIAYGPNHAQMNRRGTRMDRVRVLVGVPQGDVRRYEGELRVITDAGVPADHVHLYVSGSMGDFCADFDGNFGEM